MSNSVLKDLSRPLLHETFFPLGVPPLWCPLLTHYDDTGAIDGTRMAAHMKHLSLHVKGFLIPGSTGDGWEMSDEESREVLDIALKHAESLDAHILVGVLKTDAAAALQNIRETMEWLRKRSGENNTLAALLKTSVCGFTVCPPRGDDFAQREIRDALVPILETGLPIALYQLPQVTQNEIGPDLAYELANRFPNFILFKDTSDRDRVAESGQPLGGVLLLRGAEGDYTKWLTTGGGPYHGFLLSTANCFARELHQIIEDLAHQRASSARQMSERLYNTIKEVFKLAENIPQGNAFANSNKAMDHFIAHGPSAMKVAPPRLHAGCRLPVEFIQATGDALKRNGFMPGKGYLE